MLIRIAPRHPNSYNGDTVWFIQGYRYPNGQASDFPEFGSRLKLHPETLMAITAIPVWFNIQVCPKGARRPRFTFSAGWASAGVGEARAWGSWAGSATSGRSNSARPCARDRGFRRRTRRWTWKYTTFRTTTREGSGLGGASRCGPRSLCRIRN